MTRFTGPAVLLGLVLLLFVALVLLFKWLVDSLPEPTATFTLLATRKRARPGVQRLRSGAIARV
jgi:uncharacterized membrane-anchored protein